MTTIDHEYTDEIVCPWCGHKFSDSWEYGGGHEEYMGLIECGECGKEFYGTRDFEVTYSTQKATYGTCKACGKDNIVVESFTAHFGSYESLCPSCGRRERNKLVSEFHKK